MYLLEGDAIMVSSNRKPMPLAAMYTFAVLFVVTAYAYGALRGAPMEPLATADSFAPIMVALLPTQADLGILE